MGRCRAACFSSGSCTGVARSTCLARRCCRFYSADSSIDFFEPATDVFVKVAAAGASSTSSFVRPPPRTRARSLSSMLVAQSDSTTHLRRLTIAGLLPLMLTSRQGWTEEERNARTFVPSPITTDCKGAAYMLGGCVPTIRNLGNAQAMSMCSSSGGLLEGCIRLMAPTNTSAAAATDPSGASTSTADGHAPQAQSASQTKGINLSEGVFAGIIVAAWATGVIFAIVGFTVLNKVSSKHAITGVNGTGVKVTNLNVITSSADEHEPQLRT